MADKSVPGRRTAGPPPGRFNHEAAAAVLRLGAIAGYMCRWCERRLLTAAHGGSGTVCPDCDLCG